jgi:hypothetical protein
MKKCSLFVSLWKVRWCRRRGTGPGSISKEGAHHRRTAVWSVYDPTQQWRRRENKIT